MKLARTFILLIGLPYIILAGMAGVVLAACRATFNLLLETWSKA